MNTMSDTDSSIIAALVKEVLKLAAIIEEHQRHIFTIEAYVAAQPGYDAPRFAALLAEFRGDPLAALRRQHESGDPALLKLLRDYQGPVQ